MIFEPHEGVDDVSLSVPELRHDSSAELLGASQSGALEDSMYDGGVSPTSNKRPVDVVVSDALPTKAARDTAPTKQKSTRGARACTNCHRLKMKCEVKNDGGPCMRCVRSGHECVFLESNRGRKSDKHRKTASLQQTVKRMEHIVESVLENLHETSSSSPETDAAYAVPLGSVSEAATQMGVPPAVVDMLVLRVRDLIRSMNGTIKYTHSCSAIAGETVKYMQQLGMLEGTKNMTRWLDSSKDGFIPRVVRAAAVGMRPSTHPMMEDAATPKRGAESMKAMHLPHLPDNSLNPLGLFAEASLHNWRMQQQAGSTRVGSEASTCRESVHGDDPRPHSLADKNASPEEGHARKRRSVQFGVANDTYFHPSSMSAPRACENGADAPPELLTEGIISSEEALELFRIFFHHCSLHIYLLDPEWHTPTAVCSRSPFLFTCVCAVASKFYLRRPELYVPCQRRAIKGAFDVLSRGFKSPEIVQGFLLLTLYNQPVERYEEDRTWLFAGVAIRMAQELNMHRKCVMPPEARADEAAMRHVLNCERTWYICFCVDRTLSAQMGKPYSIREDFLIRHAPDWCVQELSRPWDLGICALVDLLRVQTRQLDFLYSSTFTPSGLHVDLDYPAILPTFNEQLSETMQFWYRHGLASFTGTSHLPSRPHDSTTVAPPQHAGSETQAPAAMAPRAEHDMHGKVLASDAADKHMSCAPTFLPTLNHAITNLDRAGSADAPRVSAWMALHETSPPAENADLATRSMYYIARQAPLRYNYAVLVLNSFGLQYALERPSDFASADKPQYLARCVHAAKEIITTVKYGMREILRYAPDPTFVTVAYACVFLLKLIQPTFARYIHEDEILVLVTHTIEVLEETAVDPSHTPALYASFLRMLIQSRLEQRSREATERSAAPGMQHANLPDPHQLKSALPPSSASVRDPTLVPPNEPSMTVNPHQVNPVAAELASREQVAPPATPAHLRRTSPSVDASKQAAAPSASSTPSNQPPFGHEDSALPAPAPVLSHVSATPHVPGDLPPKAADIPSVTHEPFPELHGWDAAQYAKAQGVEVNRVLDDSFWTSLLPPGYGGGGSMGHSGAGSAGIFELSRELDLFKSSSQWGSGRAALTPGATRPSSPTLLHMPF